MRKLTALTFVILIATAPAVASYDAGVKALHRADYTSAAIVFSAAAARGDARAEIELAKLLLAGKGVRRDTDRARMLFRRAAAKLARAAASGHSEARYQLAGLYRLGYGVRRNPARALEMIRSAARDGHAAAIYKLAVYNEWGVGIARAPNTARLLYRRAADKGSIKARIMLAARHMNGTYERFDRGQAIEYLEWAARDGSPADQLAVARWYSMKIFGDQGKRSALRLTRLAAQRGHLDAQAKLAKLYRTGSGGVTRNPVRAYVWGRLAVGRTSRGAPVSLATGGGDARLNLSAAQRASAEAWLRNWRAKP